MNRYQLHLEGTTDRGTLHLKDATIQGIRALGCGLSVGVERRSTFENCTFTNIHPSKCVVGYPIFRNCKLGPLKTHLFLYGALFLECKLQGVIKGGNFGLVPRWPVSSGERRRILNENLALLESARFSLDFREAVLGGTGIWDEALIRKVLFKRGQCLIYRGIGLRSKLKSAILETKERGIQAGLLPPLDEEPGLHLVCLEGTKGADHVAEIKRKVESLDIEVLEEPICRLP